MVERYENVNLDLNLGPSPFERASSHGALPRASSVEQAQSDGPAATLSGELAKRRLPGHKRASSLSDLSRYDPAILPCTSTQCLEEADVKVRRSLTRPELSLTWKYAWYEFYHPTLDALFRVVSHDF
jgi:hypothetical protein